MILDVSGGVSNFHTHLARCVRLVELFLFSKIDRDSRIPPAVPSGGVSIVDGRDEQSSVRPLRVRGRARGI